MTRSYWRTKAREVIERVIIRVGDVDASTLKRALRDAYPFGEREHFPYKVWCDEVRRVIGERKRQIKRDDNLDQLRLFE